MKKNFTFILLSLLLFVVGGAKSQTALPIKGGHEWVAYEEQYEKDPSWNQGTSDDHYSGVVKIKGNTAKYGRLGGKGWAGSYTGAKHTFTFVLRNDVKNQWNNPATTYSQFVLVAIKGGTYKSSGDTNDLDDSNNNWDGSNQIKNGNGSNETKIVATTGTLTPTFVDNEATITLEVNASYDAVYFCTPQGSGGDGCIKIKSITRTEGAGKATAPTITPASTDYSGSIEVTITKGSGNTAVAYTVTGADEGDISTTFTAAELSAGSKVLNLTGSGDITVTATGSEDGKDDSNTASCTYTYVIEAPTITPGTSNYDGELTVTITPGSNNHHAKYTVSGSNEDDTNVVITSATTLNLTGSSNITITATGYNSDESESSSDTGYTYTYVAPSSGESTVTDNIPHTFNSWHSSNSITLNNSNFSDMELGDYVVFGVANVEKDGTVLGFRKEWDESPYRECTTVSSGNAAKGILNRSDTQWWLKVSNDDVLNAFKNSTVRMQGGMVPKDGGDETSSVDLTSITVYHSKAISETVDNSLTKVNDVIVELTRSFTKDMWNTVCLPFKPTAAQAEELFGEDYTIAKFTGVTGTTLEFTTFKIDAFEAGQPYLVKPTASLNTPVVLFDVDITAKNGATVTHGDVTHGDYSFTGTFTTKSFAKGDWATTRFVATGNKLNTPNSTNAMKALRCYFTVPAESSVPAVSPARGYAIDGFMDDDVPTDISATLNDNVQTTKVIYNLAGQRVANPTKGLYIVNGQKVVVK